MCQAWLGDQPRRAGSDYSIGSARFYNAGYEFPGALARGRFEEARRLYNVMLGEVTAEWKRRQ